MKSKTRFNMIEKIIIKNVKPPLQNPSTREKYNLLKLEILPTNPAIIDQQHFLQD